MPNKSIRRNYIYNVIYQILLLLTPLITTPYLSRTLGPDGIGAASFAESIVSYFTLFASLGISIYGQREISYVQDDADRRSNVFWETKLLQVLTSSIVLLIYIPFAFLQTNRVIYLILSMNILAVTFDIVWLLQGLEEFGKIVSRNILIRLINIVYIYIAVKTKNDLPKYIFGLSFTLLFSNISLWYYLPKYIHRPSFREMHPVTIFKTVLTLFIPTIAIQVYTVLDKTMIGLITNNSFENGYYEQAIKISKMVLMVVTSLGTVMAPRISFHFGKGDILTVKELMYRGYRFVWFLGVPLCFGLIGIASNFVPWFFGNGFEKVIQLIQILSILIISIGINNLTGMQYLIPTKRQNILTKTVIIGAIINFTLNCWFIKEFQSIGAAIVSVIAETVVSLVQLYYIRKELSLKHILFSSAHYFLAATIMLVVLMPLSSHLSPNIFNTILLIICGILIYILVLIVIRDAFFLSNVKYLYSKLIHISKALYVHIHKDTNH